MFDKLRKALEGFTKKISKPKEEPKKESDVRVELEEAEEIEEKPRLKEVERLKTKISFVETLTKAISETKISESYFERMFSQLESELLQNNVALEVVNKLHDSLKSELVGRPLKRRDIANIVRNSLKTLIAEIFESPKPLDIYKIIEERKKEGEFTTLMFVGPNGHGKTTTLAHLASLLSQRGYRCVLAAGDTWRSAAIEQLQYHADKLGIQIVKHKYGADPAAVAYDAVRVKDKDVVLIDTAGRSHANVNLMDEMKKIKRIAKPDLTIFVGESIAGNDCVEQVKNFHAAVGIDAMILTKVDVDTKGGTLLSTVHTIKKPIIFIGAGQNYGDLEPFDVNKFTKNILD